MEPVEIQQNLLKQLSSKQISLTEFLKECAYWVLNYGFDELRPKPLPTRPDILCEYDQMDIRQKSKISEDFWHQSEVWNYLEQKTKIKNINRANYEWLQEIISYLPQEDFINRKKIENRLLEFEDFYNFRQTKHLDKNYCD